MLQNPIEIVQRHLWYIYPKVIASRSLHGRKVRSLHGGHGELKFININFFLYMEELFDDGYNFFTCNLAFFLG
jgi:hypothetical protein